MKWGRKKKLSSPSSPPSSSIITRVLPISWFPKLKQKAESSETSSAKNKHRNKLDFFPTPNSNSKEKFYSMDEDDPFWRLSFGEERIINPARGSTGGLINPVWYDFDHEFRFPVSGLESTNLRGKNVAKRDEKYRSFSDMVLDIKKMKERENKQKMKDHQLSRRVARAKQSESERDIFPVKEEFSNLAVCNSRKQPEIPSFGLNEDYAAASISEWQQDSEKMKLNAIKVKTKQKNKVKAYSPRTECKIRAIEEMKKAGMKMKRGKREEEEEGKTVFNSFAVVKNSFDPQQDFRDSMVEMIREKCIFRSEDLEELLACYLALNSDEYHDIIIEAFRKVWFELKGGVM